MNLSSQTTGQRNMPSGVFICPVGLSQGHTVLDELRLQKCGCVPLLVFVEIDRAKTAVTLNDLERPEGALKLWILLDSLANFARMAEQITLVFTALHAMQTRSSDEISVCSSVRPSVCQTRAL